MKSERWKQLKNLFEKALELRPDERPSFLNKACGDDPELRTELEALLSEHDLSASFLENPAYETAEDLLQRASGSAQIGRQLGPYTLTGKLGQGGMGVVYLAKDTRLDRVVAIKSLPKRLMMDSQHRERLKREARAAARLTHPGIATVYSLEEFEEGPCIVYEYVRGQNLLAARAKGPMEPELLLDIGIQIVSALAFAHENGVVHRDLKPENVLLTPEGVVKILDFGLARLQNPTKEAMSESRLTRPGTFLGTPAYSSPEQLLLAPVDFRTDLFSFGIMMYEMLSGRHPFAASDSFSTIARILEAEPEELTNLNPLVPTKLARIVQRCLRKDPNRRYGSTRDLLNDLEQLRQDSSVSPAWKPKGTQPQAAVGMRRRPPQTDPLWWWQFHQACIGALYYILLYPLWVAKVWTPGIYGPFLFFPALIAVGIASNLRFHLWFTSAFYPKELTWQRRRVFPWIRLADILFVVLLFAAAVAIHSAHEILATLLIVSGIGTLLAFTLIEPTTIRAAFEPPGTDDANMLS